MDDRAAQGTEAYVTNSRRFLFASMCFFASVYALYWALSLKTIIGATVDVTELQSGLVFKARVDTGASISSLHCRELVIDDEADEPAENSNKKVRFLVEDSQGEKKWLESTTLGYSGVRNSSGVSNRYRVRLRLSCRGTEKDAIVSLNDRSEMVYPLLLGRDFLEDDFVVDVSLDNPDP